MSEQNKKIEGSAIIGRDLTIGGGVTANGSSVFKKGVRVEGVLDAPNLRGTCKGLFATEEKLKDMYPTPEEGLWAMVGTTIPAKVYMAERVNGKCEWVDTGNETDGLDITIQEGSGDSALQEQIDTLKSDVTDLSTNLLRKIYGLETSDTEINRNLTSLQSQIRNIEGFVKIEVPNLTDVKMGMADADAKAILSTNKNKPIVLVDSYGRIAVPTINNYDSEGMSISYSCIDDKFRVTNYVKDICVDGIYDKSEYPSVISSKSFDDVVNISLSEISLSPYSGASGSVVYNKRTNTFLVRVYPSGVLKPDYYPEAALMSGLGIQSLYGVIPTANTLYSTASNTYLYDGTTLIAISSSGGSSSNSPSYQQESVFSRIGYSAEEVNICHDDELDYSEEVKAKYENKEIANFSNDNTLIYPPMVDVSGVKDLSRFYFKCQNILTIPALKTAFATKMVEMLAYCSSLRSIPYIDTSSVEDMDSMFYNCTSLESVPELATGKAKNMTWMFSSCTSLTTIPTLDCHSATNVSNMFNGCKALTTLPYLNTKSATNMKKMFADCSKLEKIVGLDFDSVTDMNNIFTGCSNLKSLLIYNLGKSALTFYNLSDLSNWGTGSDANRSTLIDSLINFSHNRVRDNMERATIRLSNSTYGLLSAVNLSAMSEKGYDVVAY